MVQSRRLDAEQRRRQARARAISTWPRCATTDRHPSRSTATARRADWRVRRPNRSRATGSAWSSRSRSRTSSRPSVGSCCSSRCSALGVLLVLGVLGYAVVRRSLAPLTEIEQVAEGIAAGDLGRRVPEPDERTEVGRLAGALNGMLARIERAVRDREAAADSAQQSEERMRRFIADASHELRTPLTSIRGFAELYRQGAVPPGEEADRVMGRIESEARRMNVLVEDLLQLARLDQSRPFASAPGRSRAAGRRRRVRRARGRPGPGVPGGDRWCAARGRARRRGATAAGARQPGARTRSRTRPPGHRSTVRLSAGPARSSSRWSTTARVCPTRRSPGCSSGSTAWTRRGAALAGGSGLGSRDRARDRRGARWPRRGGADARRRRDVPGPPAGCACTRWFGQRASTPVASSLSAIGRSAIPTVPSGRSQGTPRFRSRASSHDADTRSGRRSRAGREPQLQTTSRRSGRQLRRYPNAPAANPSAQTWSYAGVRRPAIRTPRPAHSRRAVPRRWRHRPDAARVVPAGRRAAVRPDAAAPLLRHAPRPRRGAGAVWSRWSRQPRSSPAASAARSARRSPTTSSQRRPAPADGGSTSVTSTSTGTGSVADAASTIMPSTVVIEVTGLVRAAWRADRRQRLRRRPRHRGPHPHERPRGHGRRFGEQPEDHGDVLGRDDRRTRPSSAWTRARTSR